MYPEHIPTQHLTIDELIDKCNEAMFRIKWHRMVYGTKSVGLRSYICYYFTVLAQRFAEKGWNNGSMFYRPFIQSEEDYDYMVKQAKTFQQYTPINYRLSESQMSALPDYAKRMGDKVEPMVEALIGDGYKLSTSYNMETNTVIVTVTTTDNVTHTTNAFVSSWGATYYDAVLIAHYKVYVVWDGGAWFEKQDGYFG